VTGGDAGNPADLLRTTIPIQEARFQKPEYGPPTQEKAVAFVWLAPPLTVDVEALAVLLKPPLTVALLAPLATLFVPPLTLAQEPLIVFERPATNPPKLL
jgi:hypothetical protein